MRKRNQRRPSSVERIACPVHERSGQTTSLIVAMMAVVASLSGFGFLELIAHRPVRTSVLTLSITYPSGEWPDNDRTSEKAAMLQRLDGATYHVRPVRWQDQADGSPLDALRDSIESVDVGGPVTQPLLVYLDAHVAVDDRGQLCLIGPGSNPRRSDTWHNLEAFVRQHLAGKSRASKRPLVICLDTNRLRRWLPAGVIDNRITTRLAELTRETTGRSSDEGDSMSSGRRVAWVMLDDCASDVNEFDEIPWTRFLCETLSATPVNATSEGGSVQRLERPDSISLPDLQVGIQSRLDRWSSEHHEVNLSVHKQPQVRLIDSHAGQPLALASIGFSDPVLNDDWGDLTTNTSEATSSPLESMHAKLESLADTDVPQRRPLAWVRLNADARTIRNALSGGSVHASRQASLLRIWKEDAERLDRLSDSTGTLINAERTPASAQLEAIRNQSKRAADAWDIVAETPTRAAMVTATRTPLNQANDQATTTEPNPFMVALLRDADCDFWRHPTMITRLATAQSSALQLIDEIPVETFASVREWVDELDLQRRRVADLALASSGEDASDYRRAIEVYERLIADLGPRIQLWSSGWQTARRANVATPFYWTWLLESHDPVATTSSVAAFLREWRSLREGCIQPPDDDTLVDAGQRKRWRQQIDHCNKFLDQTESAWRKWTLRSNEVSSTRKAMPGREASQTATLCRDFAGIAFGIELDSADDAWSAWRVRTRLRSDATTTLGLNRLGVPDWTATVALQSPEIANRWMSESRDFHIRHRLLDQVDRVIDDAWRGSTDDADDHFDRSATAMLLSVDADQPDSPTPIADGTEINLRREELQDRLKMVRSLFRDGVIQPIATLRGPSSANATTVANVYLETKLPLPDAMNGLASVRVQQDSRSLASAMMIWDSTPKADDPLRLTGPSLDGLTESTPTVQLRFRGHEWTGQVNSPEPARWVRRSNVKPLDHATITLEATPVRRRAVVMIVDSSASMHDAAPTEQTRPDFSASSSSATKVPSKLDASRAAVLSAADRLWQQSCDLGLVLYGHRVAIDAQRGSTLIQKRYAKQFPFSFATPAFRDVEVALPVGRFGSDQYAAIEDRLTRLVPWGQSPLHLAIDAAIDDLLQSGPHQSRDIVVITDGRNYQFNPTPDAVIPIDRLITRAKEASIRVHVVGFAKQANRPISDQVNHDRSFAELTQGTGGWCAAGVHDFINGLIREKEFDAKPVVVSNANGAAKPAIESTVDSQTILEGQSITIRTGGADNQRWNLSVGNETETVDVSAGDHLRLRFDSDSRADGSVSLFRRCEEPIVAESWQPLDLGRDPSTSQLGIWPTRVRDQTAAFVFGFRPQQRLTMPRPGQVWIEVTPRWVGSSTREPSLDAMRYASSLVRWVPGHGIPVAELACDGWPTDAEGFALQVWAESAMTEHPETLAWQGLSLPPGDSVSWSVNEFPGHRFELQRSEDRWTLSIQYPPVPSTHMHHACDGMSIVRANAASGLIGIGEWYSPDGHMSVHEFRVEPKPRMLTLESASSTQRDDSSLRSLSLISIADFKRNSITTSKAYRGILIRQTPSVAAATSRVSDRSRDRGRR